MADIPDPIRTSIVGPIGPITMDGFPTQFGLGVTAMPKLGIGMDPVSVAVKELPKITVAVDPVTIKPVDVNLAITRIPDVRAHLPANFTVGMKVFGIEVFSVRLTGEAQLITEPYTPNPCEEAAHPVTRPVLQALPPADD